jgi:hypothetical protein
MLGYGPGFCKSTYWNILRTAFIAANYIDLVVSIWVFLYQRGHIMELPTSENIGGGIYSRI